MPSIFSWSTTASENATADTSVNWAEGQSPSTVNNSARAMMQRVAELLKDMGGVAVAGGTANAITLATESPWTALKDGLIVTFRASAANTDETTMNVNTTSTKPIVKVTSAGEAVLSGGEIQDNGIYELVYSTDLNGAAGAWLLMNPTPLPVSEVNTGDIVARGSSTVKSGYLACDGAAVSRTTYAALFAEIGTEWGEGDGSTTFNVPDLEDEFLRGASSTRPVGTSETDALKSHLHDNGTLATASAGLHGHPVRYANDGGDNTDENGGITFQAGGVANYPAFTGTPTDTRGQQIGGAGAHTHTVTGSTASTGDTETRPRNKAVLWVIKT